MPVDGTYVVEGEYLVTVERLSTSEVKKQRNVSTVERAGRKPLRSISPSSSDENNVSPKEPKQKSSFIKKLRNSFKSKEKRMTVPKEKSADIDSEHSDDDIPIQDLSKSLGASKIDNNDTADEAEDLDIDNTDQPISQTKYTLGTSSNADPILLHVEASEGRPLLAENTGDMDLDELIKTLDNATFDIPPKSVSKACTGSSTSTITTTPSLCKGSEAGEVVLDLQLSMHSCGSSSKNTIPSIQGSPCFPHSVSGNSDIPLPVEYQTLNDEEYPEHEYQVLGGAGDPLYEIMDSSKSSLRSSSNAEFPNSAKKLISVDVIMFPGADYGAPSEFTESLHYEKISVKEVETTTPENDLNEDKADANKPKLSFLNKLKKSFKSCSSDKNKSPNIPQLSRPPSSYIGSQISLNGSVHGSVHSLSHHTSPPEKPQTPVLELLSKNPEMCSQDSLNRIARLPEVQAGAVGEVRVVMSDPDLAVSTSTSRSRSAQRGDKPKRRSRSRSLSKLIGDMARKAKSLTEVSPIPRRSEDGQKSPSSARYVNNTGVEASPAPPIPLSPPPQLPQDTDEEKPEKKRLSLVGRIKRHLSIGKGDKVEKAEKTKELSKSTPVLNQNPPPISALPRHVKRAKSTENMSTTSSTTTTTDVRTQIVLKSAKINKGCRCQVCSLVRRNIRSHCSTSDPNSRHKYEVVLKMNLLGGDFMNSECASVASYQGYEIPDEEHHTSVIEGCIAENIEAEIGSVHSGDNQLRTKTGSEIQDLVQDFQPETRSISSHHSRQSSQDTDNNLSEIRNVISSPTPRQSAV